MNPQQHEFYTVYDYKAISKVSDNNHIEYDDNYYSVVYKQCRKPAILKATHTEIRIYDSYNRLLCKHMRSYRDFPRYITEDSHMRTEHLYYKEVHSKDDSSERMKSMPFADFLKTWWCCHYPTSIIPCEGVFG